VIISASRRTDIPAFYSEWMMNRVRAGFCEVPNPVNPNQVSTVSLHPDDVDGIVFWTRNPDPLVPHIDELDGMGFRLHFLVTLVSYPPEWGPGSEPIEHATDRFRALSRRVGVERVSWRYDPVILSSVTGLEFHRDTFGRIAERLEGSTRRCIVSFADYYAKVRRRLRGLQERGVCFLEGPPDAFRAVAECLSGIAVRRGFELQSCAEETDGSPWGIRPGACIEGRLFGLDAKRCVKDPVQRPACRCCRSRDIGVYDTCPARCVYCYATNDRDRALRNHRAHDSRWPSLVRPFPGSV
jgi:hypothetical protein